MFIISTGVVIHCKLQGYINKRLISMSKIYYWRMLQSVGMYPADWKLLPKHGTYRNSRSLCYIIKVCDLSILYVLLPMGPHSGLHSGAPHRVGPRAKCPSCPPVGGPVHIIAFKMV